MKSEMTSALALALSPKRGRIVRRVLSHAIDRVILCLTANDTESATAIRIKKLSSTAIMLTLSPGERAGVRASVNQSSPFYRFFASDCT
jgi:hypothetical protein